MTFLSRCALFLSLTALAGCGTKTAEPPRDPNAPAGEVTALEGSVTAKRATATTSRTLALDADVFADDEVSTAEGSMVQIKLAHNGALWTLDASRTQRVDAIAAWSAPRQSASDLVLIRDDREDRTRAAARSGSQEGISTGESALEVAPHRGEEGQMGRKDAKPEPGPAAAMNAPVPPPEPKSPPPDSNRLFGYEADDGKSTSESSGLGGLGIRGAGPSSGGESGGGLGNIGTIGHGSGTGNGYGSGAGGLGARGNLVSVTLGNIETLPTERADIVKRVLRSNWNQVRYCVESSMKTRPDLAGKITMKLVVSLDGSVTSAVATTASGLDEQTKSCIIARTKSWAFPKGNEGITIATYEVVVKPPEEAPVDARTPAPAPTPTAGVTPIDF